MDGAARPAAERRTAVVTLVHSPACHYCDDAEAALSELSGAHAISVELVDIRSPRGQALMARHRPLMTPLVLVDGEFFSCGRLPRRKLLALLER